MIEQILVWMWRIGHCRGFGIQSPWAYSFVRYVINEHYPYYAYERLDAMAEATGMRLAGKKKGKLLFRIANFMQAAETVVLGKETRYDEYFISGCNKTHVIRVTHIASRCDIRLLWVGAQAADSCEADDLLAAVADEGMIVIDDIRRNRNAWRLWRKLRKATDGVVLFDLHYCGIVYVDPKRHRQHYIVNF